MAHKHTNIGKNIKKIRSIKKLSQSDFAGLFNLSRTSVGAYEEERAEPKIHTIIEIANHFGISIDTLLNKELTVNELYRFDIFKAGSKAKLDSAEKEPSLISNGIPFLKKELHIEYVGNRGKKDFLKSQEQISIPFKKDPDAEYIAFEMNSNGMQYQTSGIYYEDIVLAKKSNFPKEGLHVDLIYAVVTNEKVTIRRLVDARSPLLFKGDNKNYEEVSIAKDQILEVWEVIGYYTSHLTAPTHTAMRLTKLEAEVAELNIRLDKLGS